MRPCRILVIEDHEDTAESFAVCLRKAGHQVDVALCGTDGIERARRFLPEVVFCDISLPDIDGFEVARTLKADPQLAGCYLVAVSGHQPLAKDRARGFDEYLLKPVHPRDLLAALARFCGS